MNKTLVILIVLTMLIGCSKNHDMFITRTTTQGGFKDIKIGQSKREVLKALTLMGVKEVYRVKDTSSNCKASVRLQRSDFIKDCFISITVNPQEITEEEILMMSHSDLWSFEKDSKQNDLYFSDDSLKKIESTDMIISRSLVYWIQQNP